MKTLKNLDLQLKPVDTGDLITEDQYQAQPTFRKMYRLLLALGKGSPEQAVDSIDLGLKLRDCPEQVELSDTEFALLKDRVRQNPTNLIAYYFGQLLKNLEV